ncbi:MAG TPA: PilZ domain-containing protein [Candidatus Acidoferrum sp.]|jgi:hypothetical protein|nr:PilZ domain-containing protein [Candidatus Acidoferrum sp.]
MRHIHSKERRRTARVALIAPLIVEGRTAGNKKFSVPTVTKSVSGHGGSIALDVPVVIGQTLVLVNPRGGQEAECKIVSVRTGPDNTTYVGFEFAAPQCNFWHMTFTVPGARPLRHAVPVRISV